MFEGFANVWTPVLASRELGADRPVAARVAGVPLVLFRGSDGAPAALLDRCPHRGVALSLGSSRAGRLTCPFHGWQFDGSGTNVGVPWNPDARRERLCATAFPTRELGGQVWMFTGPGADGEPETDDVFLRADLRVSGFSMAFEAHWTRLMENMLDWPHLPFVHRTTIGRSLVAAAAEGRMDIQLEDKPYGFTSTIAIDGAQQSGRLDYRFPNTMVLHILSGTRSLTLQNTCVPETPTRTRLVVVTARSFLRTRLLDPVFDWQNRRIATQDKAVVESSWPAAVPPAGDERSVRTDAPTLRFRKIYFERLGPAAAR